MHLRHRPGLSGRSADDMEADEKADRDEDDYWRRSE